MNNYSIFDSIDYSDKSHFLRMADMCLRPLRVVWKGRCIRIEDAKKDDTEHKTHQIALRIFAGLLVVVTLPVILAALFIKWLKKEEWEKAILRDANEGKTEIEEILEEDECEDGEVNIVDNREDFAELIQQEYACICHLDTPLPSPEAGSWRNYGQREGEKKQTLTQYLQNHQEDVWPDNRPLYIQRIGTFSETDLKIISITSDYLHIFHHLPIQLCPTVLTMEQLSQKYEEVRTESLQKQELSRGKKFWFEHLNKLIPDSFPRANGQYDASLACHLMSTALIPGLKKTPEEQLQVIAFTSEDLFVPEMSNFVFGCAFLEGGVGIWSKARFGDPTSDPEAFQKCLLRMMKIAAHEFGHMRGLPHCTDYECNIGGYMSLKELDARPLLYCVQDSAKICHITHISMLEYHRKLLKFFENFNNNYDVNCDLSKEIETLRSRISCLTQKATQRV